MQMDEDLKALIEQLSLNLRESMRSSPKLQEILRELERRGYSTGLTLGVVLGRADRTEEIQETLIGPGALERPVSMRRLSAFDRKFLRALRIQIPS